MALFPAADDGSRERDIGILKPPPPVAPEVTTPVPGIDPTEDPAEIARA
jgi:hypothetical protein